MTLFNDLKPRSPSAPNGIDLRCCDVSEVLREVRGARLVHVDPPWLYAREAGVANPETNGIYTGLSEADIASHLDAAYDCGGQDCRLLCWYTWPKEEEWRAAGQAGERWGRRVSGGTWTKWPRLNGGVGYHWRGMTEPVALFTKGKSPVNRDESCYNGHISRQEGHSEKPVEWLRQWLRAWTSPGDLVLDLYAGLAPMARACAVEGRRYVGAEIDPERHRRALVALDEYLKRTGGTQ